MPTPRPAASAPAKPRRPPASSPAPAAPAAQSQQKPARGGRLGGAAVSATRATASLGAAATAGAARAAGSVFTGSGGPAPRAHDEGAVGLTLRVPFAAASVRLPGPGAVATVGPVRVTLPTGALYYGGLAALVVGGTLELPVAAGAMLAGAVLGRRWLRRPLPQISAFDQEPGATGPATRRDAARS